MGQGDERYGAGAPETSGSRRRWKMKHGRFYHARLNAREWRRLSSRSDQEASRAASMAVATVSIEPMPSTSVSNPLSL